MDQAKIIVAIGKTLESAGKVSKNNTINSIDVQKYIQKETGKIVSFEEIEQALNDLVFAGFMDIETANNKTINTYKRFIPPHIFKKEK